MKEQGCFLTFEGIEGCGKTTQQKLLVQWLEARGITCLATKQPGGTAIGARIREILLNPDNTHISPVCEALLYQADRAQHHHEHIAPALQAGTWVVCDRYQDSTIAYQGAARGLAPADLDAVFQLATGGLLPHKTFLLDLDPEVGLARARARNQAQDLLAEGRFEDEAMAFHRRVRAGFLALAAAQPQRFVMINAAQDPSLVAADIRAHLQSWQASLV